MFKEELNHLISIGIIEKARRSEWIAGTFIVPKKDGQVWWITDFQGLNKSLKRKVYPLQKIRRSSNTAPAINILQNSTSPCNTTPLYWMNLPGTFARLLCHSDSTDTVACPWVLVNHPIYQPK